MNHLNQTTLNILVETMQKVSLSKDPARAAFGRIGLAVAPAFFDHYVKIKEAEGSITKPADFVTGAALFCAMIASFVITNIAKPDKESQAHVEEHFMLVMMEEMMKNAAKNKVTNALTKNMTSEDLVELIYKGLGAKAV